MNILLTSKKKGIEDAKARYFKTSYPHTVCILPHVNFVPSFFGVESTCNGVNWIFEIRSDRGIRCSAVRGFGIPQTRAHMNAQMPHF
jgi:hypothetical protein